MLTAILPKTTRAVRRELMRWLFGQITQKQFIEMVGGWKPARELIEIAQNSGYMLKNCKLYAYHYWYYGYAKPDDFGVARQDTTLLRNLDLEFKHSIEPMSIIKFDRVVGRLLTSPHMTAHINKLVYRKLSFLTSYGFSLECLRSMMIEAAVYSLMKQYPAFHSPLHFQNVAKTTIHNTAQSLITAQTRQKRQRLERQDDGTFQTLFVPLDTPAVTYVNRTLGEVRMTVSESVPLDEGRAYMDSIESIVGMSSTFSPKVKTFLMCMCGMPDAGFSEYLKADNSEIIDTMRYDVYRARLEEYLGVTREQTDALFTHIREKING